MIKIFRSIKNNRVYIGNSVYASDEHFILENDDTFIALKIYNTDFYEIGGVKYTDLCREDKSPFSSHEECVDYLKNEIVGRDLKLYRFIPKGTIVKHFNFTLLDLSKESPSYERGRKTKAEYHDPIQLDLVVEKIFTDIRNGQGRLTALQVQFNWYDESGEIGETKTSIVKKYNKHEAETVERQRRDRQIDYLIAGAKDTPIEANINAIFDFLYNEVLIYKEQGIAEPMGAKLDSIQYIPNATTPEELDNNGMFYVLNSIPLPRTDDPSKVIYVIQSIKYQIGLMTLAEIEAANA